MHTVLNLLLARNSTPHLGLVCWVLGPQGRTPRSPGHVSSCYTWLLAPGWGDLAWIPPPCPDPGPRVCRLLVCASRQQPVASRTDGSLARPGQRGPLWRDQQLPQVISRSPPPAGVAEWLRTGLKSWVRVGLLVGWPGTCPACLRPMPRFPICDRGVAVVLPGQG